MASGNAVSSGESNDFAISSQCSYDNKCCPSTHGVNLNCGIRWICAWCLEYYTYSGESIEDVLHVKTDKAKHQTRSPGSLLWRSNYRLIALASPTPRTVAPMCRLDCWAEHFLSATLDQRTGRNDARVRKGSGRAVTIPVHPRYYLYWRLSSGTEVTHHRNSLFPWDVTLPETHP